METTKLSSKGQVVLPKSVRKALDWLPGADLTVEHGSDYVLLRRMPDYPPTTIDDVLGLFKLDQPITDQEIQQAIEDELEDRWRRKG